MNRELLRVLNNVKVKTGIEISAISEDGLQEASTFSVYSPIDNSVLSEFKEDVYLSDKDKKTYFKFTFNGVNYLGCIAGFSETEKNYAVFIINLIENSQNKSTQLTFDEQFLAILMGETTKTISLQFMNKYSISTAPCYCMLFKTEKDRANEVFDFLSDYTVGGSDNAVLIDNKTCAFIKFVEQNIETEYRSLSEYASFILRSMYEELGLETSVYIGGRVNIFADIVISYKQALATETMSASFGIQNGVKEYKDYILVKMVEDLSNIKVQEILNVLLDETSKQILKDKELMITGEEYLNNDLNLSETARVLYLHRNTLIYRLDKIQKITRLDIRKFNDAMKFRLISVMSKF